MKLASKNDTFIKALKHKAAWEPFYSYLLPLLCYVILIFDFLADFDFTQEKSVVFERNSDQISKSVSFSVPSDKIVELMEFFIWEVRVNDSRVRTGRQMQTLGVSNVDGKELLINTASIMR